MTRHFHPRSRDVRTAHDSLLDGLEMALDDLGIGVLDLGQANGFSEATSWAAAAAARDGAMALFIAEDERRANLARRIAETQVREGLAHGR